MDAQWSAWGRVDTAPVAMMAPAASPRQGCRRTIDAVSWRARPEELRLTETEPDECARIAFDPGGDEPGAHEELTSLLDQLSGELPLARELQRLANAEQ